MNTSMGAQVARLSFSVAVLGSFVVCGGQAPAAAFGCVAQTCEEDIVQNDSQTPRPYSAPMPRFTWRLTYAYKQDDIKLVRAERVQMIAPPPVGPAPPWGQSGHWLEVRGKDDELLYHRVLPDLIPQDREVFTSEPGRSVYRVPVKVAEGEFQVLVPDIQGAEHLTVHGHVPSRKRTEAAQILTRTTFKELVHVPRAR